MSDILKIYTSDQLYEMYKNKILNDNVGLTDFNEGSKIKSLLQSNSDIISAISMDFKEAIYNAIPIALYQGFGFAKKTAINATGYLRLYRTPAMTLTYIGSGSDALVTITSTSISATCTGAGADAFSYNFSSYATIALLVAKINTDHSAGWTATAVKVGDSNTLYQQSNTNAKTALNYLYTSGLDIMLQTDAAISSPSGFSVTLNSQQITTTAAGTILAGTAWILIAAINNTVGIVGNIAIGAVNTRNGLGYINSNVSGIQYVKNDTAFSGGADAETDDQRRTRFSLAVNSLNAGTVTGLQAAILAIDSVKSVGILPSVPNIGMVTVIVDDGTGTVSSELEDEVNLVIDGDPADMINYPGKGTAGIGYKIKAPTIHEFSPGQHGTNVTLTATVLSSVIVDYDLLEVSIQTAVEQYINTLTLGANVLLSEIIRVVKNTSSSIYDVTISEPTGNVEVLNTEFARTGSGTDAVVLVTVETSAVF